MAATDQVVVHPEGPGLILPLDSEAMFSNHKGVYRKRIEKRQTKLLKKIPSIGKFLKDDERILLITTGCSPVSILEQLLTGWILVYTKRALFVFTNRRIFHIPTKYNYSYRNSIAQIVYGDCKSMRLKGRTLVVEYKDGKKEKFFYIGRSERKKIRVLVASTSLEGDPSKSKKRRHLCPRCTEELEADKYVCAKCRLEFTDKDEGKRISLIYPGGGYFYTGHVFLGIGDAVTESLLLAMVIMSLINAVKGVEGSGVALVTFGVMLIIEKAITVYHSNHFIKEYIPKEKDITPIA